jgi:hypothetical protein
MKRGQHDSYYDRVRKRAGWTKPRYDFPDQAEVDREGYLVAERVADMASDFHARMDELNAAELRELKEQNIRAVEHSMRANRLCMAMEYRSAGVKPILTDGDGNPTVSLSLALLLGWRIEQIGDRNVLTAPASAPRKTRKEDYGNVDGS